jgi:hypothetical protein
MAAKRKKSTKKSWFSFGKNKKSSRKRSSRNAGFPWVGMIYILASIVVLAAAAAAFVYLEHYVKKSASKSPGYGGLRYEIPAWANQTLQAAIEDRAGGTEFMLDKDTARYVQQRLSTMAWMKNVKVKLTSDRVEVQADFRRPVAFVVYNGQRYYLDTEMVLLEYLPLDELITPQITGYTADVLPDLGRKWHEPDLQAAVRLIDVFNKVDARKCPEKPLLEEIKAVDVRNYNARQSDNPDDPHIVLIARDGTEINWGAEYGKSTRFLEAEDAEKINKLYDFYLEDAKRTLLGRAKYIELRRPQTAIPRPTLD